MSKHANMQRVQTAWDGIATGDYAASADITTPDGAVFDNRALWINRFDDNGTVDSIWTIDLDDSAVGQFWADRQPAAIR